MHSHIGADLDTEKAVEALSPGAGLAVQLLLAPQAVVRNIAEVLSVEAISAADHRRRGLIDHEPLHAMPSLQA